MAFYVGQKVVCVNTSQIVKCRGRASEYLSRGTIYTIRKIGESPYEPWRHVGLTVWLEEVTHGNEYWPDFPFAAVRFRPAVEKKTDISIFIAMLNTKQRELVASRKG